MAPMNRLIILLIAILIAVGCGNDKVAQLSSELEDARKEVQALRAENTRLSDQVSELRKESKDLQISVDLLTTRVAQLTQWSRQLVERFGPAIWYFGPDEKPLPYQLMEDATPQQLVKALNDLFMGADLPEITLLKVEGRTAFVHIREDTQLTQEMGSAGAIGYLQAVTYTLCSLADITHVDFDFTEGDHAVPGRYTR